MNLKNTIFSLKADESSGLLLWQVSTLWQREIKKVLLPFDLTHSQFVTLASMQWFSQQDEEVTQISLSNFTQIDPMTTSQVLKTLQKKGFISRSEHKTDTRAKSVEITQKGKEVIAQAVAKVEEFDKDFFSKLTGQEEFNKYLKQLLQVGK